LILTTSALECPSVASNRKQVIITAGVAHRVGESRLDLVENNVAILRQIVPAVQAHSPTAALCIVSNPCDIMTAVAAKLAGPSIPTGRIVGSGTCLDSSRLQSLLCRSLGLDAQSIQGYVLGEHGDSSVPVWSSVQVGGVPIGPVGKETENDDDDEDRRPDAILDALHWQVVESAGTVIRQRGYTNWAVNLTVAHIAKAVLTDNRSILPLSTCVRACVRARDPRHCGRRLFVRPVRGRRRRRYG
jgi:L-lactate dehydrogenase